MKKTIVMVLSLCLTSSAWAVTEENKKILKDAIVGAVTGAVATEATKDEKISTPAASAAAAVSEKEKGPKKNFSKKKKDKKRPHGWDMGKKTGWGGKDTPPGLTKE